MITNRANPFTSSTTIVFKTQGGRTFIQVIDTLGRMIKVLLDQDYAGPGTTTVTFDAEGLPNGIYYAGLQNGVIQQVRAMLKVRP